FCSERCKTNDLALWAEEKCQELFVLRASND
ncbi:MAG: DNA gyrase inhibitor YacG, partial [Nitrospirae bacterium]|nr:DNA gyrase inhibitor YacG [Nitrospirota bacterium]